MNDAQKNLRKTMDMTPVDDAQKNLRKTMDMTPVDDAQAHAFLMECYEAWEPYKGTIGYPHWQLKAIEEKYGFDWKDIVTKHGIEL